MYVYVYKRVVIRLASIGVDWLADWLIGCLSGICFLGATDGIPSLCKSSRLPRSLAPAGVRPLRAMVQCSHPKGSKRSQSVPIGRVLAMLVQVVPALVALSCWEAARIPRASPACRWLGASPLLLMPAESVHRLG